MEVDEQNEQTVPEIELEEEIDHDGVEQGHGQMPGLHPAALKNGPGVVDEVGDWIIHLLLLSSFNQY